MTDHLITLTTRDGQIISFKCADACDIITAAEQSAIVLPSLCKDGGCGACLAHCTEGEYRLGHHQPNALAAEAAARGDVLLCRTFPAGDLRLTAPYDHARIHFGAQPIRQAVIGKLETLADRTVKLGLNWRDETDKAVEFEPGQYMQLEIPGTGIRRAYSLANIGNWRGEMEFLIRLQPGGRFSNYLIGQAELGDALNVSGPGGAFGLQSDSLNPAIFIAGGTGLAPFIAILRRLAEWGEDRSIHLLFGVNRESELFYVDELQQLQQQIPGLSMTLCVWQPGDGWRVFTGIPADALNEYLHNHPDDYDIYLCGPPLMVEAATNIAQRHGLNESRLFAEKFA